MILVVDASFALAWLFARQDESEAAHAERGLAMLARTDALVPALWHLEIANALVVGERRGLVAQAKTAEFLANLDGLPIATDSADPANRREAVLAMARQHELTAYDAAYLELALRQHAVLASFDHALVAAAHRAGSAVFD